MFYYYFFFFECVHLCQAKSNLAQPPDKCKIHPFHSTPNRKVDCIKYCILIAYLELIFSLAPFCVRVLVRVHNGYTSAVYGLQICLVATICCPIGDFAHWKCDLLWCSFSLLFGRMKNAICCLTFDKLCTAFFFAFHADNVDINFSSWQNKYTEEHTHTHTHRGNMQTSNW